MTRGRKHSGRRPRRAARAAVPADGEQDWVIVDGRRMFVVGYTAGGAPFGIFEDEMDDCEAVEPPSSEPPF